MLVVPSLAGLGLQGARQGKMGTCFCSEQTDKCSFSYLINLTKLAPQLSTEELTFLGKEMVTALTTCCTLSEEFACVDNLVSLAHVPDYS